MSNYKLTPEIMDFVIEQKKFDTNLSCRKLALLVSEKFKVTISKSLINVILKEMNLSSAVGRRQFKEKNLDILENGGFVFLKAADLRLGLTKQVAESFLGYFPEKKLKFLHKINEILTYMEFFKFSQLSSGQQNYRKYGLWWLSDGIMSKDVLSDFCQKLNRVPIPDASSILKKLEIAHNISIFSDLYKECLYRLNTYVQTNFFPPGYQFLDPFAMKDRFYRLQANIEKKQGVLKIHLFYPPGFFWVNDVIWQEGFSYAANKVNEARIINENGEQFWINPCPCFPYENASISG